MNNEERKEMLIEAQELLRTAAELIKEATSGTKRERAVTAYLISNLEILISNDNDWVGQNPANLQSLIDSGLDYEI